MREYCEVFVDLILFDYAYVINNPWGQWKQDAKKAHFEGGGYSAQYDFDPNGNGLFVDETPGKVVK